MAFKRLIENYRRLQTIEEKSFWITAPLVSIVGIIAIISTVSFFNSKLVLLIAGICTVFPLLLIEICLRTGNYHVCYPLLCIGTGGVLIPMSFLINGGFHSGMPLYCMAATVICCFCYERRSRIITFGVSFLLNLAAFQYSKNGFDTLYRVREEDVVDDIIIAYILLSICIFFISNMLLNETRNYVNDSELLSGYMDSEIKRQLLAKSGFDGQGERRRVTVLFADISNFTSATEKMEPEALAEYLNTFLSVADKCVHQNGGIIDKYIGDCVMAYWVDPEENGADIMKSVRTVDEMRWMIREMQTEIFRKFRLELDFSAGIDYGEVVLGNIGSEGRKDYTIIGDAVNTASRLQGYAAHGELIMSGNAVEQISEFLDIVDGPNHVYLKGKNQPIDAYRVSGLKKGTVIPEQKRNSAAGSILSSAKKTVSEYKLCVCGCRGSFPVSGIRFSEFGGETSCYVVRKGSYAVVMDCGSGLINAGPLLEGCRKIDILLTHVHYDHIMGLLNLSVFPKNAVISIYGYFGGWIGENTIDTFLDSPYWPVSLHNVAKIDVMLGREIQLEENMTASFYRSFHPDNGCVIRLMAGKQKICLYSDLEDPAYLDPEIARGSDILIYDGMFDRGDPEDHTGWGHSTWQDGVDYAMKENVKCLVITHHGPSATDNQLRERERTAKRVFDRAVFARKGDVFSIPSV